MTDANPKFEALLGYIKRSRGFDFTGYKRSSLVRRVERRMQNINVETYDDYLDYLEVHPEEFSLLFNTVLINVTTFFRDALAWQCLTQEVIPQIVEARSSADEPIRVWSAGCASGEEAYTLAIVLAEALGPEQFRQRVKIYATDIDDEALSQARQASYQPKVLQSLPQDLLLRYFERSGDRHVFRSDLRRSVIFGRHDLVQDAPISRLDLLVCRNTLMYFNAETQNRVLARLHFALKGGGFLFLGKAEMLLTHAHLFTPIDLKHRIFSKVPKLNLRDRLLGLAQASEPEVASHLTRQTRLREAASDVAPVAQVAIDHNGILVLTNERARLLFGLKPHDLNRPFRDLELSYRPVELRSHIERVLSEQRPLVLSNIECLLPDSEIQYLEVQLLPLLDEGSPLGVSISFTDVTLYKRLQGQLQRSSQELETAYEELQSINEELETTNEELQSTVEELETTNEELQSTNEEMETMNEELQSTNEELQAINEELRQRTDELNTTNAFLGSILTGLRTGVVVVDRQISILIWNHRAEDLWGLRADEAQGQFFLNLDIGLPVEQLRGIIRSVLLGSAYEELLLDATNRRGRIVQCRVICTPLIGPGDENQGVILLMEEWEG